MFKLVIADDEGKQTVVPLVRDEVTIGRKEGNTIRLTERNVSRRHARLVKANGKFVVEDLHSYNGVKVNGQRIGAETALDAGDQITIGDYQLALQLDSAEATAPSHPVSAAVADADTAMIAAPGPPARLVMITPPAPGAEFALTADRTRIGRAEDLDVWVNHRSISREHAEIQKEPDGGLRLIDLGSANGVRVNGNDVQNALLTAGDVVELGQVRFRFVAAGEYYAFDADRTVQMDAVVVGGPTTNRVPLLVALAIVVLAVIGAILVAFVGGGGDDPDVAPLATGEGGAPVELTSDERYQQALAACNTALAAQDVATAVAQARAALAVRPNDEAASACQARAQESQAHEDTFQRGVGHLDRGELEEAYFLFDSLPPASPLRERPQVRQAVRGYAGIKLAQGRASLNDDPAEARRVAELVLNMIGLTAEQQAQAAQLQRDALERGASEASEPVAAVQAPRNRGGDRAGRRRSPPAQNETTAAPSEPAETPSRGGGGGGATASASLDQEVRPCVMNGDNACVIRLLEGRARTQQQLAYLIEAYRARSQQSQALRHMRVYVQRFPGTPRANQYRQIIARQN